MTASVLGGRRRIAQGREAEIFEWDDGFVLKLYRDASYGGNAAREAAALAAVRAAGGPAPDSGGTLEVDGRVGLLIERVSGIDMLTQIGRKPWTIWGAGAAMGAAHARLHATVAPPSVESLHHRIARQLERWPAEFERERDGVLRALDQLPRGDRLLHGDYHPGNVILADGSAVVIDWPNASAGPPEADIARTLLMLRVGEPPPGASPLIRLLTGIGRRLLLRRYPHGYRAVRPWDAALVDRFMLPIMAQRLSDGIPEERQKLEAMIRAELKHSATGPPRAS